VNINEMYFNFASKFIREDVEICRTDLDVNAETKFAESIIQKYWTQPKTDKTKYLGKYVNNEFLITDLSRSQSDIGYTISGKFDEYGVRLAIVPGTANSIISLLFSACLISIGFYTKFIHYDNMTVAFMGLILFSSIAIGVFKYLKYSKSDIISLLKPLPQDDSN
jgi:hypothetical protein